MIKRKDLQYLPKTELRIYFAIYLSFLFWSIYQIYKIKDIILTESQYSGFREGWSFLNRKKDDIDYEWEVLKVFIKKNFIWFIIHVASTEIIAKFKHGLIPIVHATIGSLFLYRSYGFIALVLILFQNATFYIASFGMKYVVWSCAFLWLIFINIFKSDEFKLPISSSLNLNEDESYELIIILAWNILKCLSFSLDKINEKSGYYQIKHFCGYSLYFPTMFVGPLIIYNRYKNMLQKDITIEKNLQKRLTELIINLTNCTFWLFFTDFALHFIYINNLQFNPQIVEKLNPYALYGFGYGMGQFFHNKYIVSYGIGILFMKMNNIDAPKKPKCIGRIHLYSDMWKHFDQGLYEFLFLYIYKSISDKNSSTIRKLVGSFVTFGFIYLWHGFYMFILIWSILNYLCLTIENLFRTLSHTNKYKLFIEKYLSRNNELRLNAIIGSQLFIPAAISNFYFFAGVEIGNIFVKRTLTNGFLNYFVLTICCICIYHTSEMIKRRENKIKKI